MGEPATEDDILQSALTVMRRAKASAERVSEDHWLRPGLIAVVTACRQFLRDKETAAAFDLEWSAFDSHKAITAAKQRVHDAIQRQVWEGDYCPICQDSTSLPDKDIPA